MKIKATPQNFEDANGRRRQIGSGHRREKSPYSTPTRGRRERPPGPFYYINEAAKRLGGFFKSIFSCTKTENSIANGSETDRVGELPFSPDFSKSSDTLSSSKLKSFGSSASSSVYSGPVGALNFSIEEIRKATNNFSAANLIGEGGFGTVFKGKLKDGSVVAVKRAKKIVYEKYDFKNELRTLLLIEHMNLVRLLGYLELEDEQIILVEFVGNGTLREHLDGKRGDALETGERLDIAIDVAHAITYLHTYSDPPIIHRDIKSTNILITETLRAKVADFGFARLIEEECDATHISTQVKGTAGYLDPEYIKTYQLTEKSDVYSFGVLLVELVTGRYPIEHQKPLRERLTIKWAMQKLKEGDSIIAMDHRLKRNPGSIMVVDRILRLARQCLAPSRQTRPSMKKCSEVLWSIRKDFGERASPSLHPRRFSEDFLRHGDAKKTRITYFGIEDEKSNRFVSS